MKKVFALAAITLVCAAMPVVAWSRSGQDLYNNLAETTATYEGGIAMGYVEGIADLNNYKYFCLPQSVTVGQTTQVVLNYLSKHPEDWDKRAAGSVVLALAEQWPCTKK